MRQSAHADRERTVLDYLQREVYNYREIREELKGFGNSFRTQTDTEVIRKSL